MSTLPSGTIKALQDHIAAKMTERGFDDETLHERLVLLIEEVGELAKACRKASNMNVDEKRDIQNNVGEEVADVINMIFAIGIKLGLDIEKEFVAKNEEIDKRNYGRVTT